jgi:hypothetical protein
VPTLAVLTAVPLYRVYEIPAVDPGFSPEEYARPITAEEAETVEIYRQALAAYVRMKSEPEDETESEEGDKPEEREAATLTAGEVAWIEANEKAIALTLKASRRTACDFLDANSNYIAMDVRQGGRALGRLLIVSARLLESEGKLDAAMDRYMAALRTSAHLRRRSVLVGTLVADAIEGQVYDRLPLWAAHPDQTSQRIRAAIDQLDKLAVDRPSITDVPKSEYLWTRKLILADPEALVAAGFDQDEVFTLILWARLLPWEQARTLRVLNELTDMNLDTLRRVELAVTQHYDVPQELLGLISLGGNYYGPTRGYTLQNTIHGHFLYLTAKWHIVRAFNWMETRRRVVRLLMALEGWKVEHGELPGTLDDLVGPYLDRLPVNPCSGEPFRYFAEGLPMPLKWTDRYQLTKEIEAGRPFVWSTGSQVRISRPDEDDVVSRYWIYDCRSRLHEPTSEHDVWQSGWLFPLP